MTSPKLFTPLGLRGLELRNRIAMPPMCMYSAADGIANDWHLVHYGSRAALGVGLIVMEATAVEARGRISPGDLGLWSDAQVEPMRKVVSFAKQQGTAVAVQLAHAGRKAGCARPWDGGQQLARKDGGWERVAPSPLTFKEGEEAPRPLSKDELREIVTAFAAAARRAVAADFDTVEIHAAHGYLLHQFLSPLSNRREDEYGGSFQNRARLLLEVVDSVRAALPEKMPLLVRLSATDWAPGGWDVPECVSLCGLLRDRGVDFIDASSGGLVATQKVVLGPGYQVPFAAAIRSGSGLSVGAVGLITDPKQAERILEEDKADLVFIGRQLLREPGFAWRALRELGAVALDGRAAVAGSGTDGAGVVPQYLRARREWS